MAPAFSKSGLPPGLKITPLVAALLTGFSVFASQFSLAAEVAAPADNAALPDLGTSAQKDALSVNAGPGGLSLGASFARQKLVIAPEYSKQTGTSLGVTLASMLGEDAAIGVLLNIGSEKKEWLINAGYTIDERQRFVVTVGQLRQFLDYAFLSGTEKVGLTQNSGAISYQLQLGKEFLRFLEVNGYVAKTASRDLADKTFAIDAATVFELWNDPRRIAGGQVTGLQGRLGFAPIEGSTVKVSVGQERLRYDLLAGKDSTNRMTGGVEWLQQLPDGFQLKLAADTYASQNRYSLGLTRLLNASGGGHHSLGFNIDRIRGRDGLGNDTQYQLLYSYAFGTGNRTGGTRPSSSAPLSALLNPLTANGTLPAGDQTAAAMGNKLLNQVVQRPSFIPSHVVAKIDTTALPTRLVAIDKTTLPSGTTIDAATGDITTPLGVVVTGITRVTRNGGIFANSGQFVLSGNDSLITRPGRIVQPPAGAVDTYVVALNNQVPGTTLVTIVVSHGSVKIDSITISAGVIPTASEVAIAGTAQVGQTLTGRYSYADDNNDAQGTSTFRWLRDGTAISGATASTYTLVAADQGHAVAFEVTPVSTVEPTTGTPVLSSPTVPVAGVGTPAAPTASGVAITGTAQVGRTLTGGYSYLDANNDPQGTSTVRWLRNGVAISGATASTYTLVAADQGSVITFEVTPVATVAPTTGTPVLSSPTAPVAGVGVPAAPTASGVSIAGTAQVGQTLTGRYSYADANNDAQGTSTFRWLRNGAAISGATASTYTLVAADQGSALTFEVTPIAIAAPTTGTAVLSSPTAPVASVGTPPVMGDVPNQIAAQGSPFTLALAGAVTPTNGDAIVSYAMAGTLPTGLVFNTATGQISGIPTAAGTYNVTFTARDKDGTSNADAVRFVVVALVEQGGLTWLPNTASGLNGTGQADWNTANNYCQTATINNQTGWRLPNTGELEGLAGSGLLAGKPGWAVWLTELTWSSVGGGGAHHVVRLEDGIVAASFDSEKHFVSCVR